LSVNVRNAYQLALNDASLSVVLAMRTQITQLNHYAEIICVICVRIC
jgi:hypothetical protein